MSDVFLGGTDLFKKRGGWEENEGGGVGGGCRERMLIGSKRIPLLLQKASYIWH